ncbi:hypothetical protein HPB48_008039 [Haemaphysalis longicornis]|uniref:CCHC-type domain-containing protein n=1 Tax=Haemaphysalis longicornis TaxID=44386 RepID=A0A9J6FZW3_HAELO|nr:hypothetical protein HPB48_008039 [Haemaphysalis longicornis]
MAPPGRKDGRPSTAAATVADTQTGYDPHSMVWTSIPTLDSPPELPQSFKSAALTAAVARREQVSNALRAASTDAASVAMAADPDAGACSSTISPPATHSAGPQRGNKRFLWHPQPLPKPKATDFVVVLKPRTQLSLADAFPENGAGRALIAHLGATATRLVTFVMVREQNLILVYTSHPHIADKLIGEFAVPSPAGPVPLFGYLRADTQDCCYGVVTVRSSDTEAALRESLYWPEGEILHVRRLGTSNKVRLTFSGKVKPRYVSYDALLIPVQPYKKTVPACGRCGSVGHRPDACPGPKPDFCGICGKAVPLTDGARAPHECTPRCALCAGSHVTGDRRCKERYRAPPPKTSTPPSEGQAGRKKRKRRRPRKPRKPGSRESPQGAQPPATNPDPPPRPGAVAIGPSRRGPTPDGPTAKKPNTGQAPPAPSKPNQPSPELKPAAQGDSSWAARVRKGSQVSSSGGAAFSPTPYVISQPKPPTPSTPTREQIEFRRLQAQVASLTQTVQALANRSSSPNSTPLGQAPEAMDSSPSEHRETAANLGPLEERLSNLEAQMASIGTMIENRLAAALQTAFDRIPGKIAAQMSQLTVSTRRPKLKRGSRSQASRPLSKVAEVDQQSNSSTATSEVSTGSSSGAPMQPFALLEAPHTFSSNDGGKRP